MLRKKQGNSKSTFSDFIKGIQFSINSAQTIIESQNLRTLEKFFDHDGKPKTKKLYIDDNTLIEVPLISIVNHNNISIDELEVEFQTNILGSELSELKTSDFDELNSEIERTKFYIDFTKSRKKNQMNVKIKFKSDPNPEGLERIKTEFDKKIIPINLK